MAVKTWIFVAVAIALEIGGTFLLKLSDGFARWHWGVLAMLCYWLCFWAIAPALKVLPVGIVYAAWAGMGIVGATLLGWLVFGERLGALQLALIAMILAGATGLRMTGTAAA